MTLYFIVGRKDLPGDRGNHAFALYEELPDKTNTLSGKSKCHWR